MLNRYRFLLIFALVFLFCLSFRLFQNTSSLVTQAQTVPSFVFAAAGDHGSTADADGIRSMDLVGQSGANFYLALGDLSYTAGNEQAWCNTFKSKFNNVELIAGNHDTGESPGGNINIYRTYCPFTLGTLTGDYAKQYYFDYPQTGTPLARFIMITPGVLGSIGINYNAGGAGYLFTENAINDAQAQGIKWIIVGMHKNCISTGEKRCDVGVDLMNLLINKKVDLILQGHEHNYQRSHQLGCITVNSFNTNCITDNGADGIYTKGKGPVIIINGEFGASVRFVNSADSEAGYFTKIDGTTFGVSKYSVSENQLTAQYMRSGGGSLSDAFVINSSPSATPTPTPTPDPNATPTPTPTPSPTPAPTSTPTPTPTPTASPVQTFLPTADSFVGNDFPTRNNGSSAALESDGSPKKIVYMKYDLSSLAGRTLLSAKLRMKVLNTSPGTQNIRTVTSTSWTETGITYNNRPALGSTFKTFPGGTAGNIVEVDVTAGLASSLGKVITIAVDSTNTDGYDFASRNNSVTNDRVRLLLTVQ